MRSIRNDRNTGHNSMMAQNVNKKVVSVIYSLPRVDDFSRNQAIKCTDTSIFQIIFSFSNSTYLLHFFVVKKKIDLLSHVFSVGTNIIAFLEYWKRDLYQQTRRFSAVSDCFWTLPIWISNATDLVIQYNRGCHEKRKYNFVIFGW